MWSKVELLVKCNSKVPGKDKMVKPAAMTASRIPDKVDFFWWVVVVQAVSRHIGFHDTQKPCSSPERQP